MRDKWFATAAGGGIGLLIWLVDYRFFLDAAGPPAPISRWIIETAHLDAAGAFVWVFMPAAVLVVAGIVVGCLARYALELRGARPTSSSSK